MAKSRTYIICYLPIYLLYIDLIIQPIQQSFRSRPTFQPLIIYLQGDQNFSCIGLFSLIPHSLHMAVM